MFTSLPSAIYLFLFRHFCLLQTQLSASFKGHARFYYKGNGVLHFPWLKALFFLAPNHHPVKFCKQIRISLMWIVPSRSKRCKIHCEHYPKILCSISTCGCNQWRYLQPPWGKNTLTPFCERGQRHSEKIMSCKHCTLFFKSQFQARTKYLLPLFKN